MFRLCSFGQLVLGLSKGEKLMRLSGPSIYSLGPEPIRKKKKCSYSCSFPNDKNCSDLYGGLAAVD